MIKALWTLKMRIWMLGCPPFVKTFDVDILDAARATAWLGKRPLAQPAVAYSAFFAHLAFASQSI
jgi:hypothetical protein